MEILLRSGRQVRWQGTDETGRPILVVRIGQACTDCQGGDADTLAQAIISQARIPASCHASFLHMLMLDMCRLVDSSPAEVWSSCHGVSCQYDCMLMQNNVWSTFSGCCLLV